MCGIAGFLDLTAETPAAELESYGRAMQQALRHRGPDSQGLHVEPGVVLAHTRLAVVDLSPTGHQPMPGPAGEVLVYNGELYNEPELRRLLEAEGVRFAGTSDTEVLLQALLRWGPHRALERALGMFAWALWVPAQRRLWLARDRAGEKPLYYYHGPRYCGFASELKALRGLPGFTGEVDRESLGLFLELAYVPGPRSIYRGVHKLPPGHLLCDGQPERWWTPPPHRAGASSGESLEATLRQAVAGQLVADVPIGAFLSGGVDSTLIVALMQSCSARPVQTFTLGCSAWPFDEAPYARRVAAHLGTHHHELDVTPAEALEVVPRLPSLWDEPFADSSQIPTFLMARLARRHVTVVLTGDGGDELFGGYNRYLWGPRVQRLPHGLRRLAARLIRALPPAAWDRLARALRLPFTQPGTKAYKLASLLAARPQELYHLLVRCWPDASSLVVGFAHPPPEGDCSPEGMMERDFLTYLPDDILVKVDRAAMGVSLEPRAPFLDPRVVELSRRLPLERKHRKLILRQLVHRFVPRQLMERPKMGFSIPLADWLRGPLRPWAEDLLQPHRLREHLRPEPVRQAWEAFLQGRNDAEHRLWAVLMFQSWLRP